MANRAPSAASSASVCRECLLGLPGCWVIVERPLLPRFYVNKITGAKQWEKPLAEGATSEWKEYWDRRPYWYNVRTKQSQWHCPFHPKRKRKASQALSETANTGATGTALLTPADCAHWLRIIATLKDEVQTISEARRCRREEKQHPQGSSVPPPSSAVRPLRVKQEQDDGQETTSAGQPEHLRDGPPFPAQDLPDAGGPPPAAAPPPPLPPPTPPPPPPPPPVVAPPPSPAPDHPSAEAFLQLDPDGVCEWLATRVPLKRLAEVQKCVRREQLDGEVLLRLAPDEMPVLQAQALPPNNPVDMLRLIVALQQIVEHSHVPRYRVLLPPLPLEALDEAAVAEWVTTCVCPTLDRDSVLALKLNGCSLFMDDGPAVSWRELRSLGIGPAFKILRAADFAVQKTKAIRLDE